MWPQVCLNGSGAVLSNQGQRGSLLATVVIIATVMFLMVGVVYTLFRMNVSATTFRMNGLRAATAARTGTSLAIHYLSTLQAMPATGEPFFLEMEGDSSHWLSIPGGDRFQVVIDPVNGSGGLYGNGSVEIRARGLAGDVTRDLYIRAAPAYPSSYSILTDRGIPPGFMEDGRVLDGPVHSNGIISFSSISPDSTGDPYASMISTTSSGGFSFAGAGRSDVPHPDGSSVWVQPYSRHYQGAPWWRANAPEIDFSRMREHFYRLAAGAQPSGTVSISAERVLIDGNMIVFKESETSAEETVDIAGIDLVILQNGFSPVMIKTLRIPGHPVTILARNDLLIAGSVDGGAVGSGGPFGLVALGDMIITSDPDETGGSDWTGPWQIETDCSFLIRASLAVPSGSFQAQVPYIPEEQARITISGSLTQGEMGRLSSVNSGYELGIAWDQGLAVMHPPHFPMLGRWNIYSWLADPPEREGTRIDDDIV